MRLGQLVLMYDALEGTRIPEGFAGTPWTFEFELKFTDSPALVARYHRSLEGFARTKFARRRRRRGTLRGHPNIAQSFEILRFQSSLAGRGRPDLEEVYRRTIDVMDRTGVTWTLVGAHAVNAYAKPRATVDINFVVEGKMMKRLLAALKAEFGETTTTDIGAAIGHGKTVYPGAERELRDLLDGVDAGRDVPV